MGFFDGWFDPGNEVAPVITHVSPVSFDPDFSVATITPVVIDITDVDPGVALIVVTKGDTLVYYGSPTGDFAAAYDDHSTVSAITDGYRLSFYPDAGWVPGPVTLSVTAVDLVGNIGTATVELEVPATPPRAGSPQELRDSVWRWRRRLRRQKCSVISVAIDDAYTNGPGFILTALALELGRRKGLDRVPWRGGTTTSPHGTSDISNGK